MSKVIEHSVKNEKCQEKSDFKKENLTEIKTFFENMKIIYLKL